MILESGGPRQPPDAGNCSLAERHCEMYRYWSGSFRRSRHRQHFSRTVPVLVVTPYPRRKAPGLGLSVVSQTRDRLGITCALSGLNDSKNQARRVRIFSQKGSLFQGKHVTICGSWFMVHDSRFVVYGLWFMVYGTY